MRRTDEEHLDYPFAKSQILRDLLNRDGVSIGSRHGPELGAWLNLALIICFRPRTVNGPRPQKLFCGFNPAVNKSALNAMRSTIRALKLSTRTKVSMAVKIRA